MLMKNQSDISIQRPMPTDNVADAYQRIAVTGETVQLYYYNGAVRTIDAGQAAGVAVTAQLANFPIINNIGDVIATHLDTTLTFTSTALTTEVAFPFVEAEISDCSTGTGKLAYIVANLANGEYCVDYRNGVIYGKKVSTAVTLTAGAYTIKKGLETVNVVGQSGGSTLADTTANPTTISNGAMMFVFNGTTWDRLRGDAAFNAMTSLGTQIAGEDLTNNILYTRTRPTSDGGGTTSRDISAALEASTIIKASAGVFYGGTIRVDSTAPNGTYYILLMNSATLPADGAVTLLSAPIKVVHTSGVDDLVLMDFGTYGIYGSAGLVVCISTTEFTKTISGAYLSAGICYA